MTLVISRQVSEFKSDTIQTTSENCALPTKRLFLNSFCNSSKRSSALSAPLLTLAMLESESRRITQKEIMYSSCIWHPSMGSFHNGEKKKEKKCADRLHPRAHMYELQRQRSEERPHGFSSFKPSCQSHACVCVCNTLSFFLLPHSWRPCQPPLPTTAPQLRCDRFPRHT